MYINQPKKIEMISMDLIDAYMEDVEFNPEELPIVMRMIHTTGDVDYRHIIDFHPEFIQAAKFSISNGLPIYTDTNMGRAGVNKKALEASGCELMTFISDEDVSKKAKSR